MRIAHLTKVTGVAGSEAHLISLLSGLREHGIDAELLVLVEPGNSVAAFFRLAEARGIPARPIPIYGHGDISLLARLPALLRRIRPDILHTHLLHADLYGILSARLAGVPLVISSRHNDDAFRRKMPFNQVNRALWSLTDAGVAISNAIARFTIEVEGASSAKITTIHYGLDPTRQVVNREVARADLRRQIGLSRDELVAGMVCRLTEQKGVSYGLQAFALNVEYFPAARLVIAGDGPLRPALEAEAHRLGLTDKVHFLGWQSDAPFILAGLDVLLMPSLWEGFGLVMLEAMAQSIPIIGSRVSAIPEVIVDDETGRLVPTRDVDALADALYDVFMEPALRRRLGNSGRARLESSFSVAHMINQHITLYRSLLAARRKGR